MSSEATAESLSPLPGPTARHNGPATMTRTETPLPNAQQLYVDWEGAHWSAHDIDLSRDRVDMAGLEDSERLLLYFALSRLMVAEERISTPFVGLVLAPDRQGDRRLLCLP